MSCRALLGSEWQSILVVFAVSAVVWLVHSRGFFSGFEYLALESYQLLGTSPNLPSQVVIVSIDDDYFRRRFGGRYPLEAAGVKEIIRAVAGGKPRLIAVDLDTSLWTTKDLGGIPQDVTIVWARDQVRVEHARCALPVLGGARGLLDQYTGIAAEPPDLDGVVRRYQRTIPVSGMCDSPQPETPVQSFPWAVTTVLLKVPPKQVRYPEQTELVLNFFGDRFNTQTISAETVVKVANAANSDWAERGSVRGKVALIGGQYHAAHDVHATPLGALSGARITAQAIESDLSGRGLHPANEAIMTTIEIGLGLFLVYLHRVFETGKGLVLSLAAFVFIALAGSYVAYSSFALWANFVPIFIAVLLHEFYHQAKRNRELLDKLRSKPAVVVEAAK